MTIDQIVSGVGPKHVVCITAKYGHVAEYVVRAGQIDDIAARSCDDELDVLEDLNANIVRYGEDVAHRGHDQRVVAV